MRTIIFSFGGSATAGDLLLLSYRGSRGGESTAKVVIGDGYKDGRGFAMAADLEDAVKKFAADINGGATEWSPGTFDFRATPKGMQLMLQSSTLMDDVTFHFNQEGAGAATCDIEVL